MDGVRVESEAQDTHKGKIYFHWNEGEHQAQVRSAADGGARVGIGAG